ncbi:MAG: mucoidy inhibitor MuiA family protein [Desulfuromonadaceae bacterium]|nr:mucoidy inhibitor MuiA family protein [Desulfuromonadaceae bacterium]MDD2848178.1 mucoidy inhibitor MuiA family protein [Desulfuromonadaceae bacterium]MDD4130655.1 mucoidy inhibitor MuiA family protein [Desulfuromonadaceae bacterium]
MKSLRNFLFLILILAPTISSSADFKRIPAVSRINTVIVYTDRALTTRSATFNLKPGSYLIAFESLPTLILDDSVRVTGKGTAAATIAGLEIKRTFLEGSGEKRVQKLQEEIRVLERSSAGLDARKSGITAQIAFLDSIRVAWGERISKELAVGRPTTAELLNASSFVGSGITKAEEQSRDIEFEKKGIKDQIDALRRQQNEATGSTLKEVKTVEVTVEVAREGKLTLELASMTRQASWEPSYDARLAADAKSAELTFRAMVRQQTGEDWNNVDLTLSTARPAVGGAPPELSPWHISLYRPQPTMLRALSAAAAPRAMAKMSNRTPMEYDALESAAAEEAPAAFVTAQVSDEQSSISFRVPRTLDIPADGTPHGTVVAVEQLPVNLEYMTLPKLSPSVFIRSEAVNKAAYPLLPGKVNTFVGNSYTGSSRMKRIATGEKFDLFFGSDDQITVKREELKQQKEAGMFGKNLVSYRYRIELGNFRKEPVLLTLRDQLPIAANEEIKVSLEEPSLKPEEIKSDGTLTWKIPLKSGEKKELTFSILVEYPKEKEITGL